MTSLPKFVESSEYVCKWCDHVEKDERWCSKSSVEARERVIVERLDFIRNCLYECATPKTSLIELEVFNLIREMEGKR